METAFGGAMRRARAELGVSSFGLAVIDMAPNEARFPEHDHRGDRQEEVYVVLRGSAEIVLDGGAAREQLDPETMIRVGPLTRRKLLAGPEGVRLLALGATPGELYDPPDFSKLGQLPLAGGRRDEGY